MTKKEEAQIKREEKAEKERERICDMQAFERDCILEKYGPDFFPELAGGKGNILICGIDEAGRGPLAGPVAAGAVILPPDCDILRINDSKKLSPKKREELYQEITEKAISWSVAMVGPERIDEINILQATYEAMRTAISQLSRKPDVLVNDAVTIPDIHIPQVPVVKGDAKCYSVAAASILAKVTRDRLMLTYDEKYPEYGFAKHKGYGTAQHIEALKKYGPCEIHRKTFITHFF